MKRVEQQLIVSCQALPEEPLHSSYIMGRMAMAAKEGGARGIRANSVADITEIKQCVNLPVIAIIKRVYPGSDVFITPTMTEVDELMEISPDVIALDATRTSRPDGKTLEDFFSAIKAKYPNQALMADCSTKDEMIHADKLGFDYIGTTLVGYTKQSLGVNIEANDFALIREVLREVKHPVIAEGNINTPQKAKRVLKLGCYSVVVGSSITRPQLITQAYTDAINQ